MRQKSLKKFWKKPRLKGDTARPPNPSVQSQPVIRSEPPILTTSPVQLPAPMQSPKPTQAPRAAPVQSPSPIKSPPPPMFSPSPMRSGSPFRSPVSLSGILEIPRAIRGRPLPASALGAAPMRSAPPQPASGSTKQATTGPPALSDVGPFPPPVSSRKAAGIHLASRAPVAGGGASSRSSSPEEHVRQRKYESAIGAEPAQEMLEEGFAYLAAVISDTRPMLPTERDSPRTFQSKRNALINRIVPMNLVPLATANGLLVMGAGHTTGPDGDCYFPLPQYLLWTGAVSLSLVTAGVTARHVLRWVLADRKVSDVESFILTLMEYVCDSASLGEVAMLLIGTFYILPHLGELTTDPKEKGKPDSKYCEYGIVMFALVLLSMCWLYLLIGAICFLYIKCIGQDMTVAMKAMEEEFRETPIQLSSADLEYLVSMSRRVNLMERMGGERVPEKEVEEGEGGGVEMAENPDSDDEPRRTTAELRKNRRQPE